MPLVECQGCHIKYIIHRLALKDFDDFYNDPRYFDSEYAGGVALKYADNVREMQQKATRVLKIIKRYKPSGYFIDIGCAGGYLLEIARDTFGYDARGVEVSKEMSAEAQARGVTVHCGTIENMPKHWPKFDVLYMGDVLEHIPDPKKFMKHVRGVAAIGAVMAIEVPLTYHMTLSGIFIGLINMLRGKFGRLYFLPAQHRHEFADKPPYHVLMFDQRSVRNFFEREGFIVKYVKIFEGAPKPHFARTWYGRLKSVTHWLTWYMPQRSLGDRMIVIAEKQ